MESLLTNYNKWNPHRLKKAKETLLKKGHNMEDSEELRIIVFLLNNECEIVQKESDGNFAKVFQANNYLFEEEYAEYMNAIIDYYSSQKVEVVAEPYEILKLSYEHIMAKLDDFMNSIDPVWYDLFYELYVDRKNVIKFTDASTESLYLPNSNLWLANVQRNDTIDDYANIARVYGEGIAAKLRKDCVRTPDEQVLIQAFAKALQYIFMTKLDDYGIQGEVTKFFNKDFIDNARRVKSVRDKFLIDSLISNPKSANHLANLLSSRSITCPSKERIKESYKKTVKRDIQKIITDLILRELIITYAENKDKFIHDMHALVTSEESPAKTLEKLDIRLNSIYHR